MASPQRETSSAPGGQSGDRAGTVHARGFGAVVFDMDGVVTDTAAVHSLAWKQMFDEFLVARAQKLGVALEEFSPARDYRNHVDGKPRYEGVESFLWSRGINLPRGTLADPATAATVCGLGNRKNELFNAIIATEGVKLYDSTVVLIDDLRVAGVLVGLATSSRNAATVLAKTGMVRRFATVVDGVVSERLGLRGKPQPDIFLAAAANLGVPAARTIVVEDAVSGVQAGAAGGFGLVVGVARDGQAAELRANGADVVVADLAEVNLEEINRLVRRKAGGR